MKPIDLETKRFQHYFGVTDVFQDRVLSAATGKYVLDLMKFDDWLHVHKGYDEEKHGSMKDFIEKEVSVGACHFIMELLDMPVEE
jgi:hypothetical protein